MHTAMTGWNRKTQKKNKLQPNTSIQTMPMNGDYNAGFGWRKGSSAVLYLCAH
jgi:hypothetical protein